VSMLTCPACGKLSPLSRYDPRDYEPDILVCELRGLGRGRGFEVTSVRSVFKDMASSNVRVAVERLCDGCLEILQMMLDNDIITKRDLIERLEIADDERSDFSKLAFAFMNRIEEFLYDADEETQGLAVRLRRLALAESAE